MVNQNEPALIPCKPSSKDIEVVLKNANDEVMNDTICEKFIVTKGFMCNFKDELDLLTCSDKGSVKMNIPHTKCTSNFSEKFR